ncbi:unnamed protein product [Rhodiola kirilowii]
MDCSWLQKPWTISTPVRGPSNLPKLTTTVGTYGPVQALRFRVTKNFQQKLNAKLYLPFSGEFSAGQGLDNGCRNSKFLVKADSGQPLESGHASSSSPRSSWESVGHGIDVFYRFSRAYVLIGRFIGVLSMSLLAMEKLSDFSPLYLKGLLKASVAAALMHLYVVGLNQLTDIEIDKVNKPYLPLASGEYSYKTGSLIVAFSAIVSFCIGWTEGSWPLFWALFGDFLIGTVYSVDLPLLRWKRSGFLAAVCIVLLWGVFLPVPCYLHFQTHLLQKPAIFSMPLIFTTVFVSFFSVIIALVKDIPDIEGDKMFGIQSYTSRLGQERVFWICVTLLEMAYGAAICVGAMSPNLWSKWAMVVGHSIMAMALWNRAKQTDVKNKDATQAFYMFIWKLLYAEYLLVPFLRY